MCNYYAVVEVNIQPTATFSEVSNSPEVCVSLAGMSSVPVGLTVVSFDGKFCYLC